MTIRKVIFVGKSKKKTGTTRFMFKALARRVAKALFINVPRTRKLFFWRDYKKILEKKIVRFNPDLVLIYSRDLPYDILKKISSRCITAMFYGDTIEPFSEKILNYARQVD